MPVQLVAVALKGLLGGALVTVFAALGDLIKPRAFAGLFAAAPSVALASLLVTVLTTGPAKAAVSSRGMIAGAVGMVAYCTAASVLVKRFGAGVGSVLAWVFWVVPALLVFWFFLR